MLNEFSLDQPIEFHLQHHQRINVYELGDDSAKKSLLQILQSTSYVTNTQNILQTNSELNSTDSPKKHPLIKKHHPQKSTQEHPRHGVKITDVVSCPTCTSCILKNTSRHHLLRRCSDTLEQAACAIIGMGIYIIPALVILCLLGLFDKEMIQYFLWNLPVLGSLLFAEKTPWEITIEIIIIILSIYFSLLILERIIRAHSSNLYRKAFDGDTIYVRHQCKQCREKFAIKIPKSEAYRYK